MEGVWIAAAVSLGAAGLFGAMARKRRPDGAVPEIHDPAALARALGPCARLGRDRRAASLRRRDLAELRRALDALERLGGSDPEETWLWDHGTFLEQRLMDLAEAARNRRVRLPMADGVTRVEALARCLVDGSPSALTEAALWEKLEAFQLETPLTLAELDALPEALAARWAHRAAMAAKDCAERAASARRGARDGEKRLAPERKRLFTPSGLDAAYAEAYLQALTDAREPQRELLGRLETLLEEAGQSADNLAALARARALSARAEGQSAVESLRFLAQLPRETWQEKAGVVEALFREDGVYCAMDDASRDAYRAALADFARRHLLPESFVAARVLRLAQAHASDPKRAHVGWYLLGEGMPELAASFGKKSPRTPERRRFLLIQGLWWALSAAVILAAFAWGGVHWLIALWLPARAFAWRILERWKAPPFRHFLPRLKVEKTLPEGRRMVMTLPSLVTKPEDVDELFARLEACFWGNRLEGVSFALLADLPETKAEDFPGNKEILARGRACAARLNALYGGEIFHFLLRRRVYVQTQRAYLGRERKRGALEALNRLIAEGDCGAFLFPETCPASLAYADWVVCADADTVLLPGSLARFAGALAHPLNRPVVKDGRVVSGYGLILPRLENAWVETRRRFARTVTGEGGLDAYAFAGSDFHQGHSGEALYMGKGAYWVKTALETASRFIPEEAVLSHDLLEGCFLRAGRLPDLPALEGTPSTFAAWLKRLERWTRGDWQLLSWLFPHVRTKEGLRRNPLTLLHRSWMLQNLLRSLTPAALILLPLWGVVTDRPWWGLALSALFCLTPGLEAIVRQLFRPAEARDWALSLDALRREAWEFMSLPRIAWTQTAAALRALLRLVTRRGLLTWTTAAQSEAVSGSRFLLHLPQAAYALILALLGWQLSWPEGVFAALFWLGGIVWNLALERPQAVKDEGMGEATLLRYARDTWSYFDRIYAAEDHFLPPDAWQRDPVERLAHRSSPTNFGLFLVAQACGALLGFLSWEAAAERVGHILDSLLLLERWRGHWYNWYDTRSLAVLEPRYISAVDSGNLMACLCLASALFAAVDPSLSQRLERAAMEIDLSALYDERRALFVIGLQPGQNPPSGCYDLLASEARLTAFLAAATGQVPLASWYALGRPVTRQGKGRMLLSWSGTFFEYGMPALFLREPEGSLLSEARRLALAAQIRRGEKRERPWGVTESGCHAFDLDMNYQYRAFGDPACAMRRDEDAGRIVAPYASFLALGQDRAAALSNLARLEELGLYEDWGFSEALDFDPARLREGSKSARIRETMAHHQGMILMALTNALCGDALREAFHSLPYVRGAEALLAEKPARGAGVHRPRLRGRKQEPPQTLPYPGVSAESGVWPPELCALSGGDLTVYAGTQGLTRLVWAGKELAWSGLRLAFVCPGLGALTLRDGASLSLEGHRVRYRQTLGPLTLETTFFVDPGKPILFGNVTLANEGERTRTLDVTACLEPLLADWSAALSHPAYQGLFLQTEAEDETLSCERRIQKPEEPRLAFALALWGQGGFSWSLSRAECLGRENVAFPECLPETLSCAEGAQTDPALCLRRRVTLEAGQEATLRLLLACGDSAASARERLRPASAAEVFAAGEDLAWHAQQSILRSLSVSPREAALAQRLLPFLATEGLIQKARLPYLLHADGGAGDLWCWGLPERLPLIVLEIRRVQDAEAFRHLASCLCLLRERGVPAAMVALYRDGGDYPRSLEQALRREALRFPGAKLGESLFILRREPHSRREIETLLASARLILRAERPLTAQLEALPEVQALPSGLPSEPMGAEAELASFNGWGGFDPEGRYYRVCPLPGRPPRPWAQGLSNGVSGAVVTTDFGGFLFQGNAQRQPLTAFSGDALRDPPWMKILLTEPSGAVCELSRPGGAIVIPGSLRWHYGAGETQATMDLFAPGTGELLVFLLRVKCAREGQARLHLFPNLALLPPASRPTGRWTPLERGLFFENTPVSAGTLFFALAESGTREGAWRIDAPEIDLPFYARAGETRLFAFGIGRRETREEAREAVAALPSADSLAGLLSRVHADWESRLAALRVETPDGDFNRMVNTFLPYQVWACRMLAKAGYSQVGGATGFRDQLQDAVALLWHDPTLARRQILASAAHQFPEGDVMHWWHEPALGVRTRISDDRLFLPWAALEYVRFTGDESLWEESAPYLSGPALAQGQTDAFFEAEPEGSGTVFDHCVRAVERSLVFGPHGLPLIGGGDWNDGMNRLGLQGRGESVFLAFFLLWILPRMIPQLLRRGDAERAERWEKIRASLLEAVEREAWAEGRYLRAYDDEGRALGVESASACRIDALTQAWAVFALGDTERTRRAVDTALERLWDRKRHLFRLLDPPFTTPGEAGYISGYQPGLRENGAQYTHAAAWMVLALCRLGKREAAYALFRDLLPCTHTDTPEKALTYGGEPYAVAADVCTAPGLEGRAGWTWYTGSAGWLLRAAVEGILGVEKQGDAYRVHPCLPEGWPGAKVAHRGRTLQIAP